MAAKEESVGAPSSSGDEESYDRRLALGKEHRSAPVAGRMERKLRLVEKGLTGVAALYETAATRTAARAEKAHSDTRRSERRASSQNLMKGVPLAAGGALERPKSEGGRNGGESQCDKSQPRVKIDAGRSESKKNKLKETGLPPRRPKRKDSSDEDFVLPGGDLALYGELEESDGDSGGEVENTLRNIAERKHRYKALRPEDGELRVWEAEGERRIAQTTLSRNDKKERLRDDSDCKDKRKSRPEGRKVPPKLTIADSTAAARIPPSSPRPYRPRRVISPEPLFGSDGSSSDTSKTHLRRPISSSVPDTGGSRRTVPLGTGASPPQSPISRCAGSVSPSIGTGREERTPTPDLRGPFKRPDSFAVRAIGRHPSKTSGDIEGTAVDTMVRAGSPSSRPSTAINTASHSGAPSKLSIPKPNGMLCRFTWEEELEAELDTLPSEPKHLTSNGILEQPADDHCLPAHEQTAIKATELALAKSLLGDVHHPKSPAKPEQDLVEMVRRKRAREVTEESIVAAGGIAQESRNGSHIEGIEGGGKSWNDPVSSESGEKPDLEKATQAPNLDPDSSVGSSKSSTPLAQKMTGCTHLPAAKLTAPSLHQQVHKEECTLCFDDQDNPSGILVCASCFNGSCLSSDREHAQLHFERTGHAIGLMIKRTRKVKVASARDDKPPPLKKLALIVPADEEIYTLETEWRCFLCPGGGQRGVKIEIGEGGEAEKLESLKSSILKHLSSATQSEVKAWEEEIEACEHTLTVEQWEGAGLIGDGGKVSQTCAVCDLDANLWLCLTCGMVNCGRKQFGGVGGNGHALDHFSETGHPVGVKLGTITPEGGGDIYCYTCNDAKIDPDMAAHLKTFGIEIMGQTKTEKSMTELQIEHNLKFDFSMTGEDGTELQPIFGAGLTGLKNLGNSCYMASVLQSIFALPAFRKRYDTSSSQHFQNCMVPLPADCLECQMLKMSDGLLSGRYSHPAAAPPAPITVTDTPFASDSAPHFQEGIRPAMFKELVGKGHAEFSTMRQQDSEEFLQHLLDRLRQETKRNGNQAVFEASETFRFALEQRLMCTECKSVSYKADQTDTISLPVPVKEKELILDATADGAAVPSIQYESVALTSCVEALVADEALDYQCTNCKKGVVAIKSTRFKTFPETLVLHMRKFQLVNWLPTKIDVPIDVPEQLTLDSYIGNGQQEGEILFAAEDETSGPAAPTFNEAAMSQLEGMGFPTIRCQKALLATGNADAEAAMNWLFSHMEDADIDSPLPTTAEAASKEPGEAQVTMLADMGFTTAQAKKALRETNGNPERAVEWLFSHPDDDGAESSAPPTSTNAAVLPGSTKIPALYRLKAFISHKGPSVHSGHYVATIREMSETGSDEWVLFNDERVVKADDKGTQDLMSKAYLYIYERV